jgi:hypothetical protein
LNNSGTIKKSEIFKGGVFPEKLDIQASLGEIEESYGSEAFTAVNTSVKKYSYQ